MIFRPSWLELEPMAGFVNLKLMCFDEDCKPHNTGIVRLNADITTIEGRLLLKDRISPTGDTGVIHIDSAYHTKSVYEFCRMFPDGKVLPFKMTTKGKVWPNYKVAPDCDRVSILKDVLKAMEECRDIDDVYPVIEKMIKECK